MTEEKTWAALYEALAAHAPDLDTGRLTDLQLSEIGVSREQAEQYAAWLGGTIESLRDPHYVREEDATAYLEHLAEFAERQAAGEDISLWRED